MFALAAGYAPILVAGTALGGFGLVLTIAQRTYAIPLAVALRLELTSALDLLRQAFMVAGILMLVVAGGGLLTFFILPIPVALAVLVITLSIVRRYGRLRPTVDERNCFCCSGTCRRLQHSCSARSSTESQS